VGTLMNGEEYRQVDVSDLRIRGGKIASIAEHDNALTAREKLVPLVASAQAKFPTRAQ
jgi:uncharacterized protein